MRLSRPRMRTTGCGRIILGEVVVTGSTAPVGGVGASAKGAGGGGAAVGCGSGSEVGSGAGAGAGRVVTTSVEDETRHSVAPRYRTVSMTRKRLSRSASVTV